MSKLPVLYLSCETEALTGPKGQESLRRLVPRDQVVDSVAFITSEEGGAQPNILHQCGEGVLARRLQSDMKARGFEVVPVSDLLLSPVPVTAEAEVAVQGLYALNE